MIMENAEILHSELVWKTILYCVTIAAIGILATMYVFKKIYK